MSESKSFQRASSVALRFIAYRPRSEAEVRRRLRLRFPTHLVDRVVADLVERSLIDDDEFARTWRDYRGRLSPRSAAAIRRELLAKGVSRDTAQEAVGDLDDVDGALRAGRKFARRLEHARYPDFRRKLWAHLQRRGFGTSVARHTVSKIWEELQQEAEDQ